MSRPPGWYLILFAVWSIATAVEMVVAVRSKRRMIKETQEFFAELKRGRKP